MYYILLPKEMVERRHIFQTNTKLPEPDGRTAITVRELGYLSFSLGEVEVINDTDLKKKIHSLQQQPAQSATTNKKED